MTEYVSHRMERKYGRSFSDTKMVVVTYDDNDKECQTELGYFCYYHNLELISIFDGCFGIFKKLQA